MLMMIMAYAYPGSVHYNSPEGGQVVVTAVDIGHIEPLPSPEGFDVGCQGSQQGIIVFTLLSYKRVRDELESCDGSMV